MINRTKCGIDMNNKGMMGIVLSAIIIAAFLIFLMLVAINTTNNSIEKFCITNGYTSTGFIDVDNFKQYFCIDENRITRIINGLDGKYYLMKEESE